MISARATLIRYAVDFIKRKRRASSNPCVSGEPRTIPQARSSLPSRLSPPYGRSHPHRVKGLTGLHLPVLPSRLGCELELPACSAQAVRSTAGEKLSGGLLTARVSSDREQSGRCRHSPARTRVSASKRLASDRRNSQRRAAREPANSPSRPGRWPPLAWQLLDAPLDLANLFAGRLGLGGLAAREPSLA